MQRALGGDGTPALPDESAERLLAQARCPLLGTRHVSARAWREKPRAWSGPKVLAVGRCCPHD
eukprot:687201-Prymnesium_polylepis.1